MLTSHVCYHQGDREPIDLVADSPTTRDAWVDTLTHLVVTIRSLGQQQEYEMYLKKQFQNADKNKNGSLTFDEVKTLVDQLNVKIEKEDLRRLFNAANKNKSTKDQKEALDEEEFVAFYYSLLKRPEIEAVFFKFAGKDGPGPVGMSAKELAIFQKDVQKEELLEEECQKIISAFEPVPGSLTFSLEGKTKGESVL